MAETDVDPGRITGYHAHVYYTPATKPVAARVRAAIEARFDVRMGRWHDAPVGPHPVSMYQVAFEAAQFPEIMPWLMLNREGLDVLVHPDTGDAYADHTDNAAWLGTRMDLVLSALPPRQC